MTHAHQFTKFNSFLQLLLLLLLLLLLFCSYAIALLDDGQEPVKYLGPDDKVMTVKGSLSTTAQLVLCIRTPEKSLLEVISSIKNNVSTKLIE